MKKRPSIFSSFIGLGKLDQVSKIVADRRVVGGVLPLLRPSVPGSVSVSGFRRCPFRRLLLVLLVGLLRRLVEEERRQGGDHETEELENSPEDVSDVPGLSGRSGGRGRGRSIARNSAHLGQVLLLVSSEGC